VQQIRGESSKTHRSEPRTRTNWAAHRARYGPGPGLVFSSGALHNGAVITPATLLILYHAFSPQDAQGRPPSYPGGTPPPAYSQQPWFPKAAQEKLSGIWGGAGCDCEKDLHIDDPENILAKLAPPGNNRMAAGAVKKKGYDYKYLCLCHGVSTPQSINWVVLKRPCRRRW